MIAWGSPNPAAPLQPTEHQKIEAVLAGHDFVRAFPGAGVLTLMDESQRIALEQQLVQIVAQGLQGRIQFLISPLMGPGLGIYRGLLPQSLWEPLNKKVV